MSCICKSEAVFLLLKGERPILLVILLKGHRYELILLEIPLKIAGYNFPF